MLEFYLIIFNIDFRSFPWCSILLFTFYPQVFDNSNYFPLWQDIPPQPLRRQLCLLQVCRTCDKGPHTHLQHRLKTTHIHRRVSETSWSWVSRAKTLYSTRNYNTWS